MIKNWTVKVIQIRNSGFKKKYKRVINNGGVTKYKAISGKGRKVNNGFINHVNYLKDKSRPSHKHTKITVLLNNAHNILNAIEERKIYRKSEGLVGGGVRNFASSIVCVIPNSINQPKNISEWSKISSRVIFDVAKTTNLPFDLIKKHTHIVLHDESASADKHSHIHVLVSNVINNEVVKVISQRKTVHAIKMGFNKSVKVVLNEDHKNYVPKNIKVFDKPLWLARQEKNIQLEIDAKNIEAEIKQKKLKLLKVNNLIIFLTKKLIIVKKDISIWTDHFLNGFYFLAEEKAKFVAKVINDIESIAEEQAAELDKTILKVEEGNKSAPASAKISSKRKRRRRKNKNT
ncbi:MAG: hypothetical protein ACJA2M_001681 [Polaribacter sp.]|jgi:hypothetical protein